MSDTELLGAASSYATVVPDHEKYFVHFFARDCDAIEGLTDGECTTITKQMVPLAGDDNAPGDSTLHGMFSACGARPRQTGQRARSRADAAAPAEVLILPAE